ncbi:MAG: S9 family peptidase [Planctomycetota bacterium]
MILPLLALSSFPLLQTPGTDVSTEGAELERLTLDLLLEWESVSSPSIGPNGESVVFARRWTDKVNDRTRSELWIMNRDGSRPRKLCDGSSPVWSPSGDRIAFLEQGEPSGSQVHVMYVDTREVTQVTRVTEAPRGLRWSPDGRSIAFQMIVPEKNDALSIQLPARPKGAKWAEEPKVITRLSYRRDRSGYRPKGWNHLFVVDANGGTPRRVTEGDFDHGAPEWTADGERLLFSGLLEEDADWIVGVSQVYDVHVDSGEVRQLTDRKGPDGGAVMAPDGSRIAYVGNDWLGDTYHVGEVHVMDADGGDVRVLTGDLDRSPRGLVWAHDSSAIYFTAESEGSRHLHRVDLEGHVTQLTEGALDFRLGSLGRDGAAYGVLSTPHEPGDVVRLEPRGDGRPGFERLTAVHDDLLERVTLGEVEEIRYASSDGLEIQGWIVKPPDFDPSQKYPLILQIHGGPHAMYGVRFDFEKQNHAAEGYVVLYTNPRGSTGYGKDFGCAIQNAYPGKDYDDLMAGVDEVVSRGYVDEDRMFVYGGSGGGVLTCWIVGMTDRFRAAVSMFPVTNWVSFVGTTDGPYWYTNFKTRPWESIDEHWRRSPLRLVGNVSTPTMLITGELDLRTPMAQTEEYYQALKLRKVDTAMVRIPNEYHGAAGRHVSNRLRRILYVRGWFQEYDEDGTEGAGASLTAVSGR